MDGRLLVALTVGALAVPALRRGSLAWGRGGDVDTAIEAWLRDESFRRASCSVSTDGYTLKSYADVIGETVLIKGRREKVVWDKCASHTTRSHIKKAERAGALLRDPKDRNALALTGPVTTVLQRPADPPDPAWEADQEWRNRGPWDIDFNAMGSGWTIKNAETGATKSFPSMTRGNVYEKAIKECAKRNRAIHAKRG